MTAVSKLTNAALGLQIARKIDNHAREPLDQDQLLRLAELRSELERRIDRVFDIQTPAQGS